MARVRAGWRHRGLLVCVLGAGGVAVAAQQPPNSGVAALDREVVLPGAGSATGGP